MKMDDIDGEEHLLYTPPTLEEAQQWADSDSRGGVSTFACRYPGRYVEAADLTRKVLRIDELSSEE